MIRLGCAGQDRQVYALLRTACSRSAAKAWMKSVYRPNDVLWFEEDGKMRAFLQMQHFTFQLQGKRASLTWLDWGVLEPQGDPAWMQALLKKALEISRKKDLFCAMSSPSQKLLQSLGFWPVSTVVQTPVTKTENVQGYSVSPWDGEDLYPLYQQFMTLFDGVIYLDEAQFAACLSRAIRSTQILLCVRHQEKVCGFGLLRHDKEGLELYCCVYTQLEALQALCAGVLEQYGPFMLTTSGSEPVSYITSRKSRKKETFCLRIHDEQLLRRWQTKPDQTDSGSTYSVMQTSKPSWNGLLPL